MMCLVWMGIYLFRRKNSTQKFLMRLLLMASFYFFIYAVYICPNFDNRLIVLLDLVGVPLSLALQASCIIYVHAHLKNRKFSDAKVQWLYMPAIVMGTIVSVFYYLIGFDDIEKFYVAYDSVSEMNTEIPIYRKMPAEFKTEIFRLFYWLDIEIVYITNIFMTVLTLIMCYIVSREEGFRFGDSLRYWFKGQQTTPARAASYWIVVMMITISPLMIWGTLFIRKNLGLGIFISVLLAVELFLLCYCEYFSFISSYKLSTLAHIDMFESMKEEKVLESIINRDANNCSDETSDNRKNNIEGENNIPILVELTS